MRSLAASARTLVGCLLLVSLGWMVGCGSDSKKSGDDNGRGGNAGAAGLASNAGASGEDLDDAEKERQQTCAPEVAIGGVAVSVPSGTFEGTLEVALSTELANAEIRYTLDGQPPAVSSTLYEAPISLSRTTQIRAQAFVDGAKAENETLAIYMQRDFDASHDVPVVVMDAYGHGPLDEENRDYVPVAFMAFNVFAGSASVSAAPTVVSRAGFHLRGQSSVNFDKKPYRLELWYDDLADRDCVLFGMPAEGDWALMGPFPDKALVRNQFIYELGRDMGLQAPRVVPIELYLNLENKPVSASDYQGVYLLTETIKNHRNRTNLQELQAEDIAEPAVSGGYIFKLDWKAAEEPLVRCPGTAKNCWKDMELVEPNPVAVEQMKYLTNYLIGFNDMMHGGDIANKETGYPSYIDVQSFVDQIIINELSRSMDGYVRSQYFYKDRTEENRDSKLHTGPLWDYDLTFGVGGSLDNLNTEGLQLESGASRSVADWFTILMADSEFHSTLVARWRELRKGLLSDAQLTSRLTSLTSPLAAAAERNFARWNILTTETIFAFTTPTEDTYAGQVEAMKSWMLARAAYLDTIW